MSRLNVENIRHPDAASDSLQLSNAGNVTAPGNLSVTGTSTLTDDLVVDTDTLFVDVSTDRVGIGLTSPQRLLHLDGGSGGVQIQLTNDTTGKTTDGDGFQLQLAGDGTARVTQRENLDLAFDTNNTERLRILSDGTLRLLNSAGIDFSQIQTNAAGMTSEILDSYEEGTYTPTDVSGAGLSFSAAGGFYTKIGRLVTCFFYVTFPSTANTSPVAIGGLPFTTGNNVAGGVWTGAVAYNTYGSVALIGPSSVTSFNLGIPGGTDITNANMSLKAIRGSFSYYVA